MWQTKFGKCIYTSPSGYKVYQNFLCRWLTFGSPALQTVIYRTNLKKPVLHYLPALSLMARAYPNSSCLLGLGGGGIAHMLSSNSSTPKIVAVEYSDEVIHIAKQFFMVDSIPNLSIVHQNALDYLRQSPESFSHIMVDLYDANHFPADCASNLFFSLCKEKLTEDGFIAINLANMVDQWPLLLLLKKQFKTAVVIPVKRSANMVIIASRCDDGEWLITKLRETGEIKKILWVEAWGFVGEFKGS